MKKILLIFTTVLMTAAASAQNYSGTLTFNSTVFPISTDLINTEINNQTLQVAKVGEGNVYDFRFASVPILKAGEPSVIAFSGTIENGAITAAPFAGNFGGVPITFTLASGSVSGDNIAFALLIKDNATGGLVLNATTNYTGVKQTETGINDVPVTKTVAAYYTLTGKKLDVAPETGVYIIVYDDGKTEKVVK